jgi:hypothetical protein
MHGFFMAAFFEQCAQDEAAHLAAILGVAPIRNPLGVYNNTVARMWR